MTSFPEKMITIREYLDQNHPNFQAAQRTMTDISTTQREMSYIDNIFKWKDFDHIKT